MDETSVGPQRRTLFRADLGSSDPVETMARAAATFRRLVNSLPSSTTITCRWGAAPAVRPSTSRFKRLSPSASAKGAAQPSSTEPWHTLTAEQALAVCQSSAARGLEAGEAEYRLALYGPNQLPELHRRSPWEIFAGQLTSVPILLLIGSAALSIATGGVADAAAIVAVVLVNASIGYVAESSGEKTISSLEQGVQERARVIRGGAIVDIDTAALVPGDLIVLGPGSLVPADGRLIAASLLYVDESSLTGESLPVQKIQGPLAGDSIPIADRHNMVFRGTVVTGGAGIALLVATGADTEIGRIQSLVGAIERRETPLQREISHLGVQLVITSGVVCAAVFALGIAKGFGLLEMLHASIALAVAAVPEGLPTVTITTLSLGIGRMKERRALVRHLNAVETLGAIQTLCLDKTGTITENRMRVAAITAGARRFEVSSGRIELEGEPVDPRFHEDIQPLLLCIVLCNEVELIQENGSTTLRGSSTEAALIEIARSAGLDVRSLREAYPLLETRHRTETRSFMETVHELKDGGGCLIAMKGSPSAVLSSCSSYLEGGAPKPLTEERRAAAEAENERMAARALRVLGVAYRLERGAKDAVGDSGFIWLGLVGMADPPRRGIADIIARLHRAGVHPMMVTGDQSATARAIGEAIGLSRDGRLDILDYAAFDALDPEQMRDLLQRAHILARVSPAHKLRIVQALQRASRVVSMTGDGINDSPALKAADVGVAMGAGGTAAAREAADVVLLDDDLGTMIAAIEQGRTIYDDIKKAVHFILSTNLSEILLMFGALAAGFGQALTPMQLLWINMFTDIFPELALAVEPPESDVLDRPPRPAGKPMFARGDLGRIAVEGAVVTAGAAAAYGVGLARYGIGPRSGSLAFTSLTCAQLLHTLSARSERTTIFDRETRPRNKYMSPVLGASFGLQIVASASPSMRGFLGTVPLGLFDWALVGVAAVAPLLVNEALKILRRSRAPEAAALPVAGAEEHLHGIIK